MENKPYFAKASQDKPETANEREERILKFWQEDKTFEKTLKKDSPKGEYIFYDGPPFATGLPHYGHILASAIKDTIPRYQTMKGFHVERRWGWDCHGLPVETIVEKQLGLKNKGEIERIGVDVFNETARSKVLDYVGEWKKTVDRIGRWVNFDGAYKTMDNSYIESVWWALKQIDDKGRLYEGNKVLLYCPRCETPVSKAEVAMDNSYKDVTEEAVYIKFKVKSPEKHNFPTDTYILAWTTTPWTLPANVALAVNPEMKYLVVKKDESSLIVAKDRVEKVGGGVALDKEFSGKDLVGIEYEPLYQIDKIKDSNKKAWVVLPADFVTATDGTGVVHTAVMYGEDDYNLGIKYDIAQAPLLDQAGHFNTDAPEFIRGQYFKKAEKAIKDDLESRKLLFLRENNTHPYPHCWRCDTALIYNAVSAWFIKIQDIKPRLLELNQKMNWIPDHLKDGRFKNILEGAPDWNISRNRYWASPLPIWRCSMCKKTEVLGSLEDIKKRRKPANRYHIMRHGQTVANIEGTVTWDLNGHGLTDEGRANVQLSAESLKGQNFDLIIASDFIRARDTAEIVADTIGYDKDKIVYDERIRELNFGVYNNETIEKYHSHFKNQLERFHVQPEGGESLSDVKHRVGSFLYSLEEKYKNKNILIVSHGDPVWLMQAVAMGMRPEDVVADEALEARATAKGADKFHGSYNHLHYLNNAEVHQLDFSPLPHNKNFELDFHKPYIDEVTYDCDCGGKYKRTSEVIDCWFESAAMPFAANHYPFENKDWFKTHFPGDFVAEYIAQTRTWFYYCLVVSGVLFDNIPYKNIVTTGTILAEDGSKMSKSKGNFPDPWLLLGKYGADALRFYLLSTSLMKSEDLRFSEKGVDEIYKKLILRLQNVVSFYELYAGEVPADKKGGENILDKWIRVRLSSLKREVEEHLDSYELDRASRPIMDFVDDLSTWYVRRSRDRFKSEDVAEKNSAFGTTRHILIELSKIIAPFTPFIAEDIYQKVARDGKASVHMQSWPASVEVEDNSKLFEEMNVVRQVVSLALDERKKLGLAVRQPLKELKVKSGKLKGRIELLELIKDEVNVKEVGFDEKMETEIWLDINLTPELKEEGSFRDLTRHLQDMRKKMGLQPEQKVVLTYSGGDDVKNFINKFTPDLQRIVGVSSVKEAENDGLSGQGEEVKIGEMVLRITLSV
ncbi:MAG: class I tRNA ligase family protein [bacterium]|nr:class I tRNA ligase family protein [bacterium]